MVVSKINANVSYPEIKKIDPDDLTDEEKDLYQIQAMGVDIIIALGNAKNTYEPQNIVYFPIYLVKTNNKVIKIGVYEIQATNYSAYTDSTDQVIVENLEEPLFFSFINSEMLEKLAKKPETPLYRKEKVKTEKQELEPDEIIEEAYIEEYKIPPEREDIFKPVPDFALPALLKEENEYKAKQIKEQYKESPNHNWLQKFMQNDNYGIIDNEGGGDCLFLAVRQAFYSIGQKTEVKYLRKKLSKEATDSIFRGYKEHYDNIYQSMITNKKMKDELKKRYSEIEIELKNTLDKNKKKSIIEQGKQIYNEFNKISNEINEQNKLLQDIKFMKGIDTLEKFQQKIKSCDFWADTWAISTLERILNIKLILLSSENYKANDIHNILLCGQLNDNILENKGVFMPELYIVLEYTGNHYKLVTYRNKSVFKFKEIPYYLKRMIVDKCMEKNAGAFSLIPDFKKFKQSKSKKPTEINYEDFSETKLRGLYDDKIVFVFYHKSNPKYFPGTGSGEKIPVEEKKDFMELASIPDWRRKLDDYWIEPFRLDNHAWNSVEHYYQASKFKKYNPEFYLNFSLDSGTELSLDAEMAKAAGSKTGKYKDQLLRPKQVTIDPEFKAKTKNILEESRYAKFSQNPELKKTLLATKNAKLTHFIKGQDPEALDDLMLIRDKLSRA
jgi:predicted NAD-dependent protein-ADP-ribosyltransferase YbiA (DUF1768 family)